MKERKRKYMTFYASFLDTLDDIQDRELKLKLFEAITTYGIYGREIPLEGLASTFWKLIRPTISKCLVKYDSGLKGGGQIGNKNASKVPQPPLNVEPSIIVEPSITEINRLFHECGCGDISEARKFFDYYSARGWAISGDCKIKNLESAVRNWLNRKKQLPNKKTQADYVEAAQQARIAETEELIRRTANTDTNIVGL